MSKHKLIFDHENSVWRKEIILRTIPNFTFEGVLDIDENGEPIIGAFELNPRKNHKIHMPNGQIKYTIEEIIHKDYEMSLNSGVYYNKTKADLVGYYNIKNVITGYSKPLEYRCGYRMKEFQKAARPWPTRCKHNFASVTRNYTFGIEYETNGGYIPEPDILRAGMIPVKDGSLRNPEYTALEYATIPMKNGDINSRIYYQCELLDKFCKKSHNEALHVHIGGIKRNKEVAVAYYKTIVAIQDELYQMFPPAMAHTGEFKPSGMDYCAPLHKFRTSGDVDMDFMKIFNILTSGRPNTARYAFTNMEDEHPDDPENNRKWNVRARYKIINLVPFVFGKSGTVEYRVHTPSFSPEKIIMWKNLISLISKYVENHSKEIAELKSYPKISMNDIIFDDIANVSHAESFELFRLAAYVEYRKMLMNKFENEGDRIGVLDVGNDDIEEFLSDCHDSFYFERAITFKKFIKTFIGKVKDHLK